MKPCLRKVMKSTDYLVGNLNSNFGASNTVANINGSTKKLGTNYQNVTVVLFNKLNFQAIAVRKPDSLGNYRFLGLNTSLSCFIVGFDQKQQYNAVIQDMVVPK